MMTSEDAVFLVGGIIRSLLPPLCAHGWSPDRWFILGTCLASFYTLSSWKSRPWWIVGRGEYFASVIVLFGGCFATVFFGGCFATGGYFEFGGCFAAIPLRWRILCRRGRAIRWMLRHRLVLHACSPWHLWQQFFCACPALRVAFVWVACVESPPLPCFLCCPPVVLVASAVCVLVCTFYSVFLLSLVLCVLVLAKSCLAAASLCL